MTVTVTDLLDNVYNEAEILLTKTQGYLAEEGEMEVNPVTGFGHMRFSEEIARITVRLTNVMTWVLYQKSINDGEITPEKALEKTEFLMHDIECLVNDPGIGVYLPRKLCELSEASHKLYTRIYRLDSMVRCKA